MVNNNVNNASNTFLSWVTCCRSNDPSSLSNRIITFVYENRGSSFLAATIVVAALCSPQAITLSMAIDIFVSGILTSCSIQIIATFLGKNGLADSESGERLAALFGVSNLCILYLYPLAGFGSAIYDGAIGLASLLVRSNWSVPQAVG